MLLRRGLLYPGPGEPWASQRHLAWLGSVSLPDRLAQVVLGEYLACHEALLARRDRLDALIAEQANTERWTALVGRLRCMRGIDTLTAVGLVAEIGDFHAFSHSRQLASFVGLVPSERSSGEKRRQGTITKAGSAHARRLLIEVAWHYRRQPAVSLTLRRRQDGQPGAAIQAAWRAQLRLSGRWAHLDARRAKRRTTVAVAVARELACVVWEIARQPDWRTPHSPFEVGVAAGARQTRSAIRVTACVRVPDGDGGRAQEVREFRTTTAGLITLADWLRSYAVTVVGMESTAVYWRAIYYLLEDEFECQLFNARHLRHVPGRKAMSRTPSGAAS